MSVLCCLLVGAMILTRTTPFTAREAAEVFFCTPRGWLLIGALVLLSAAYPRFGFCRRRIEGDLDVHRTQLLNAFRSEGYGLAGEADGTLRFRAEGLLQRVMQLGEDEIRVSQYGQWIEFDGRRKAVVRIAYRLENYIARSHEE